MGQMFLRAMERRWTTCFALLIIVSEIHGCWSVNSEGSALLHFRAKVEFDPSGALANWNPNDCDPCMWLGVECLDGEVVVLNLNGRHLEGVLAPELGNLTHLRFLDLSNNHLSGRIPSQLGQLTTLEVLDLRDNYLSGTVPSELGKLHSLKRLLLCNNRFEGSIPVEIRKLSRLIDMQFDEVLTSATAARIGCVNRKFGRCIWQGQSKKSEYFGNSIKWSIIGCLKLLQKFKFGSELSYNHGDDNCSNLRDSPEARVIPNIEMQASNVRRVLVEQSSNLIALSPNGGAPLPSEGVISLPSRSSGSFPANPNQKKLSPSPILSPTSPQENAPADPTNPVGNSGNSLKLIIGISIAIFLLILVAVILLIFRSRAVKTIGPWKTGLSGQLQKAFITGVPKLNRAELETACEDFSNIIHTRDGVVTLYKGTLSSGVEIAVVSTAISSTKAWSQRSELAFRKKIDTLSRVNHKNFVNLIGYCEEDEPFTRMMVFEYAPNGSVFEHLHVKDLEHLDWSTRMRIIMGTAYCLQHMHELNPPVVHANITARDIFLTDDYAAKIGDASFWEELVAKSKNAAEMGSEDSELPPLDDVETNVHSFGILLLEIISGKLSCSEGRGNLVNWAAEYWNDRHTMGQLIDPTLASFNENELDVLCEVIQSCTQQDSRKRPSMNEVVQKLKQVLGISPEAAIPRLSPLWWAELEILSAEAA